MTVVPRQVFHSRLTTVLTMIGVAVGLGNVWRFPYMMGRYGGSAFLLAYVAFVILFALPALMAEWAFGRETRNGPLGAFQHTFGRAGSVVGAILLFTVLVANSYYLVVVSNVTYTAAFSLVYGFDSANAGSYQAGLNNGGLQAAIAIAIIGTAMFVLTKGLNRGIERISKIFVPLFGIIVTYLIVSSLALPGAVSALGSFLRPDVSQLNGTSIFAAMGQAFFSLSLGGTFYVIYGSYLRESETIPKPAALTAMGDVGAALLASLFIVPTTLVFGIDMSTGPQLIFETLPELFRQIPGGRVLGTLFLVGLGLVAYLSSVAAFQVLAGALTDSFSLPILKAVVIVATAETVLMVPTAMNPALIGPLDLVFGSGMQVLGSGLTLVALTWGLGRATTLKQIFPDSRTWVSSVYYHWVKWVVPAVLLVILAGYVVQSLG